MLQEKNMVGRTITLKVKYANFEQVVRSVSLDQHTNLEADVVACAHELLTKTEVHQRPVRLLGVSLANLASTDTPQTSDNASKVC